MGIAINLPVGDGLAPIYGDFGDGVLFSLTVYHINYSMEKMMMKHGIWGIYSIFRQTLESDL